LHLTNTNGDLQQTRPGSVIPIPIRTDIAVFSNTDSDTDVGITNTEKYRIPTKKYRKYRTAVFLTSVSLFSR